MADGRYFDSYLGGGLYGHNWYGIYQIRTYTATEDPLGSTLYIADISVHDKEMNFGSIFQLVFDDYNDDGNPDFTLGQWFSNNGNAYKIFTIKPDGKVEELNTNGIFLSRNHDFSVQLDKINPKSFSTSYYDNSIGKSVEEIYEWHIDRFIQING